ncbi:MAG: hypothetical protein AB7I41_08790 [Candidatus Sericytochromatia bacterium]
MSGVSLRTPGSQEPVLNRFNQLNDAIKAAAEKGGSEAIVKHTGDDGQIYYSLREVTKNEVQNYGAADLDPNIVKFSVDAKDLDLPETATSPPAGAERILEANVLSTRNAIQNGLKTVLPPGVINDPAAKNSLAQGLGFKDFDTFYTQLSQLPPAKQQQFIQILSQPQLWQSVKDKVTQSLQTHSLRNYPQVLADFAKEMQTLGTTLKGQLTTLLKSEVDSLFEGKGTPAFDPALGNADSKWSPAALLGVYNSLSNIKTQSPQDFQRLQAITNDPTKKPLTFKYDSQPPVSTKENIALEDPVSLLTNSMKIAHTSCGDCKEHVITIRDGAIKGSSEPILNSAVLEKLTFLSRGNLDHKPIPGFQHGLNHWYTLPEMTERKLVTGNPPGVDQAAALKLLSDLNATGSDKEKTWRLLGAMGNALGTFDPAKLKENPVLCQYLKTDKSGNLGSGLDMTKLWDVFFKGGGNSAKIDEIKGALDTLLPTIKPQSLINTVFKMEQMKQVESVQGFLNEIKPGLAKDLLTDGNIGARTEASIQRLEAIMALNAIKENLPQPLTASQNRKINEVMAQITSDPFSPQKLANVKREMGSLIQTVADGNKLVQEHPPKTLKQTLNRLVNNIDGKMDSQTTRDLVDTWLKVVDTKGDGAIIEDLVTHEVGHNLMEIFKKEHPEINLERDWAAITGSSDSSGPSTFTVTPMTQALFGQGEEEVSKYGQTSSNEDFAESYRLFMSNPEELYAKAPTKFLVINALSGRFTEAQVKERFGASSPEKLSQAWQKITGQAGSQFHFSAPMLAQLNKTYPELAAAGGNPDASMTSEQVDAAPPPPPPAPAPKPETLLSPQRLLDASQLTSPPLSKEQLNATHQAVLKLVQHVQAGKGTLNKADIQALLGADYAKLPPGFQAMLDNPDSTLMQYINNPNHFSRQNAVTWIQSEVLNQVIGAYEKANASAVSFKNLLGRCTRASKNEHNMPHISPADLKRFYDAALAHVKAQMALMSPPPPIKSDQEMIAIFETALRNMSTGNDKAEKYTRDINQALGLA